MYGALKNGDVHLLNRLKNEFQTQFGYPAPNDVAALSSIIGGEVVKATVGAQNALGDREEVRSSISRDLSQMQADSVIDKYQKLMGGQLNARRFAYEQATGLHNFDEKFLLPRSQQVLKSIGAESASGEKPKPTQTDIDYARSHPEVKEKFKARFGVEP
jgi:ribosomal protein S24E